MELNKVMGLGGFWLKFNNGKSFNLESLQELIKEESTAGNQTLEKLFCIFDTDHDGKISTINSKGEKELESIFSQFNTAAGDNKVLEESEVSKYLADNNLDKDLSVNDVFNFLGKFIKTDNKEVKQTRDQSIVDRLTELGTIQPTITDAEFEKIREEAYNTVLTSTLSTEALDKDYDDIHTFAKEKLSKSGKEPTLQEVILYSAELQMLNPDVKADKKIKKGVSINIPAKSIDKKNVEILKSKGIRVEKDNYIFFQKLLELDDTKQAVVLNIIKNSKFTTKEEVINEIYTKTKINLADTGLTIKVGSVSSTLENFITKTLKLDLSSKEGLKIYDRLCSLGEDVSSIQAVLDSFPKEFINKLSKMNNMTFDKFADKAEVFGIILRTDEEIKEREKNIQAYRDFKARMYMAQYVADNYDASVTLSKKADRELNFTQGTWWVRHSSRPIAGTSTTDEQRRDIKKVEQIKQLMLDIDTISNEEFSKRMTTIMEAQRTVHSPGAVGAPVAAATFEIKDKSFNFDPKLAYTFMKQAQRAELAATVAKRLEPERKQKGEKQPQVTQLESTRVYNPQLELADNEYTVKELDKDEIEQLTQYIKSIKTKKELFLFAKSLHYKAGILDNKVKKITINGNKAEMSTFEDKLETMIPKEYQADIQKMLEQKAKELGYAEPTRPNSISLDTFRNVFTKPIDKKVNYPKTNEKTLMETYEITKTKLLGTWDPVGKEMRTQNLEGTVGGVLDITIMLPVTRGMGTMKAFVKIGSLGRNIGTATNVFKTANVASRFTKNATLINRLAKADKVLGGLWVNGAAGALHGAATMGAYGGLQGTVGMADNTVKNLLEGKNWSDGLGERFEQTLVMGYENAKFGLFAGYSGVLAQALGKGTVALGAKGIDKLFKTKYSKTVLDKVSNIVTEEGITGSKFWTEMHKASKAEGFVGFGYETGFFTLYHKMEEAGVDFNDEESLLTYIQNNLDEETKQSLGATYLSEGGNLAMFKIIGSLIQWVHIGRMSSGAAIEIQANKNRALKNMNMRKVVENGKESYLVKFNENDKPIKVAPEQLMQLCEQKMFYSNVEDIVQKDGSFKLPNNQTVEYDKAKKVYSTVIDTDNTIEATSVEDLLAKVNQITFKNRIDEQLTKENKVELNDGIILTKTDGKYQIEILLEDGKKVPVQSEDLNDVIMRAQLVKMLYDAKGGKQSVEAVDVGENPANHAGTKITQQWILDGINKSAPEMVLKNKANPISDEVSLLIMSGRLNENLTGRYNALSEALQKFSKKHSFVISHLYKQCGGSTQKFAVEFLKMLSKEYGKTDILPQVFFSLDSSSTRGSFDYVNNRITILEDMDITNLCEVLIHEYTHALQFYDILARQGEEGLRDVVMNNKTSSQDKKDRVLNTVLNNKDYQKIMSDAKSGKVEGSVDDYLSRIYKQEFTNDINANENYQAYISQIIELEAYYLGENNGIELSLDFVKEMTKQRDIGDKPVEVERNYKIDENISKVIEDITNNNSFRQISAKEVQEFVQLPEFVEFRVAIGGRRTQQMLTKIANLMKKHMPKTYEYIKDKLAAKLLRSDSDAQLEVINSKFKYKYFEAKSEEEKTAVEQEWLDIYAQVGHSQDEAKEQIAQTKYMFNLEEVTKEVKMKDVSANEDSQAYSNPADPKVLAEIKGKRIVDTPLDSKVERAVRKEYLNRYEKIESDEGKDIDKKIFNLLKDIKDNEKIDTKKVEELRKDIKLLAQTNPEEAANLELVLEGRTTTKKGSEATREEITAIVQHLRRQFELEKNDITSWLISMGAKELGTLTNRIKGDMSETDKITNYALQNPDQPFAMAIRDVRDNYGGRIEISALDVKNTVPEVQKLINEGKYDEAGALAMQSVAGNVAKFMKSIINDPKHYATIERVSNYKDSANISVISKSLMEQLEIEAIKSGMPIVLDSWKLKQQGSAYNALQINLKTKTGRVIEIQIRLDEVGKYAEVEHYVYDLMTGKDIIGRKEKLSPLFKQLETCLKENLTQEEYETYYLPYTRAQYHYRLLKAFGIETPEPRLEDFPPPPGKTFDPRLKAENLFKIHDLEKKVLEGKLTPEQAVEEYNKLLQD